MSGKDITITVKDGNFQGYLATPSGQAAGGVVVVQEVFGVNTWMRQITDFFASQGFIALCPDLFWRQKPGVQLDATIPEQFKQGIDYMMKFDFPKGIADIQGAIDTLRKTPGCKGKVGVTGFCMGGLMTYLSAANNDGNAHASYYGGGIDQQLGEAKKIKTPIIFHLAGNDGYIPPPAQKAIQDAAAQLKDAKVYVYDGTEHGFARETDPKHYSAAASKLAHERTVELFRRTLA
jgi:carboxymethylenebutenolidase